LRAVLGLGGPATPLPGPAIRRIDLLPVTASAIEPVVREVAVGRHSIRIGVLAWVLT
jgi:hypothetical protein